ncbi:MAG TPA: winged helix-turn-helix domain-containing protein [Erysipelothrix sp.]|nr:winged helix-turn-helix domain-containing protein [Erysipelothrix sp.]
MLNQILIVDTSHEIYDVLGSDSLVYIADPVDALSYLAQHQTGLVIATEKYELMTGIQLLNATKKIVTDIQTIYMLDKMDDKQELEALSNGIHYVYAKDRSKSLFKYKVDTLIESRSIRKRILSSNLENIEIHLESYEVYKDGKIVKLTPKEFDILSLLIKNRNQVLNRSEIIEMIWEGKSYGVDERTIDVHIRRIREKLNTRSIISIRGVGYKWSDKRL